MGRTVKVETMENMENILQLGAMGVILLFTIKELFAYLKTKKDKEVGGGEGLSKSILTQLELMNSNHLHTIQDRIESGNKELVETIHRDNTEIIKILSEIKGALNK